MTEIAQRSEGLVSKLRADEFTREQIKMALPPSVSLDRFTRAAMTALIQTPELAKSDEPSLFQAIVKCAQDGLLPDGREAALVAYKGKVQYLPMIQGVRNIAAGFGWTIKTHVIYAGDEFAVDLGTEHVTHKPAPFGTDRGAIVGAWAGAYHRDGRRSITEVMTLADIEKAKAVAQTDRVWKQWPAQMCEKTVGHRIAKKLPLDPVDAERLARVSAALEPGDAAVMLYGPDARPSFGELPSGEQAYVHADVEVSSVPQPAEAAPETASDGGAPGSSGGDTDPSALPDGSSDGEAAAAPSPLPEPSEHEVMLSLEAAEYLPPSGPYGPEREGGPLSIAAIYAEGDPGVKYLVFLLRRLGAGEFRDQVEAFTRVAMPTEYFQILNEKQAA